MTPANAAIPPVRADVSAPPVRADLSAPPVRAEIFAQHFLTPDGKRDTDVLLHSRSRDLVGIPRPDLMFVSNPGSPVLSALPLVISPPALRPKPRPPVVVASRSDNILPAPYASLRGQSEETCLSMAIYHEARGESREGQMAVASVILQRVEVPGRWGNRICSVLDPDAFSFVNDDFNIPPVRDLQAWTTSGEIARKMIATGPLPGLQGADHFHSSAVKPDWRLRMKRITRIGQHIFYTDPDSRSGS